MQPIETTPDPVTSAEVLRVEALTDADDTIKVPLGPDGVVISVIPTRLWRSSALSALNGGDFETWAEACLSPAGREAWLDIDPTVEEIQEFFAEWRDRGGQMSPLGSRGSRRSSTNGRHR